MNNDNKDATAGEALKPDIAEAKKAINCLAFAIDNASVLADVTRIMQGLVDEIERLRRTSAGPAAVEAARRIVESAPAFASSATIEAVSIARALLASTSTKDK